MKIINKIILFFKRRKADKKRGYKIDYLYRLNEFIDDVLYRSRNGETEILTAKKFKSLKELVELA